MQFTVTVTVFPLGIDRHLLGLQLVAASEGNGALLNHYKNNMKRLWLALLHSVIVTMFLPPTQSIKNLRLSKDFVIRATCHVRTENVFLQNVKE